ncbi:MAG: FkbM family methyltransferase [Candidatus Lokiarchaeota archaeon]|nr:FkbM family methyltransferase [Candidatus Lokiarchaeota archaeon]
MKFVQIGACAGGDEVFDFVKDKDVELGILVEPIPDFYDRLCDCYKNVNNIYVEQVAVVPDQVEDKTVRMHWTEKHHGVGSVFKEHVHAHGYSDDDIKIVEVPTCGINSLLKKYDIKDLDYLFIDVEGLDAANLLSLDLNEFNIDVISYEWFHIRDQEQQLIKHFWDHGYAIGPNRKYDRSVYKIKGHRFEWN